MAVTEIRLIQQPRRGERERNARSGEDAIRRYSLEDHDGCDVVPPREAKLAGEAVRRKHGRMPINADWHGKHPMPKNPTVEQRTARYLAPKEHCACPRIPEQLQELMSAWQKASSARPRKRS